MSENNIDDEIILYGYNIEDDYTMTIKKDYFVDSKRYYVDVMKECSISKK